MIMSTRRGEVSLVAVDADTGQTVWTTPQPESAYACGDSSAILVDLPQADIIFHHLWHAAVALDPDTGAVLWQIKTKHGSQLTPVHNEGCLFMATGTDKSYRMLQFADDGREFKELWRRQDIQPISQAVFLNDMLFVFGRERTPEDKEGRSRKRNEPALLCFDVKTGDLIKQQVVMEGNGSLIAADGKLYCVEGAERHWKTPLISLVEPTDGGFELVGRFTPEVGTKECYVNVTLHNGRMFHRHGRLLAVYDVRAR